MYIYIFGVPKSVGWAGFQRIYEVLYSLIWVFIKPRMKKVMHKLISHFLKMDGLISPEMNGISHIFSAMTLTPIDPYWPLDHLIGLFCTEESVEEWGCPIFCGTKPKKHQDLASDLRQPALLRWWVRGSLGLFPKRNQQHLQHLTFSQTFGSDGGFQKCTYPQIDGW